MIDIKDEVLESEARYRIRDAKGNILFDNLTIEQITPVIQQATPQNKVLYDSIKSGNDLVQKFNVPKVLMNDKNYNYLELDNVITQYEKGMRVFVEIKNDLEKFEESILPTFEGVTTQNGFTLKYSSETTEIQKAFDKNDSTSCVLANDLSTYATIEFPSAIKIEKIKAVFERKKYTAGNYSALTVATIKGKIKGDSGFTNIFNDENSEVGVIDIQPEFNSDVLYNALQITLQTGKGGSYTGKNTLYTFDLLKGYIEKINFNLQTYININGLGNKLINGTLAENKKYILVYDGTVFNATEVV